MTRTPLIPIPFRRSYPSETEAVSDVTTHIVPRSLAQWLWAYVFLFAMYSRASVVHSVFAIRCGTERQCRTGCVSTLVSSSVKGVWRCNCSLFWKDGMQCLYVIAWYMYRNFLCQKQCDLYAKGLTKDSSTEMLVERVIIISNYMIHPERGRRYRSWIKCWQLLSSLWILWGRCLIGIHGL